MKADASCELVLRLLVLPGLCWCQRGCRAPCQFRLPRAVHARANVACHVLETLPRCLFMVQRRGFITHPPSQVRTFSSSVGALSACWPCGVSPTDPLPPSVSPSSLRSLPPVLQRALLPVPLSDLQAQSAPQLSLCWYQVLPATEPPAPRGVLLSPAAAGSAVRCKPAAHQRAALREAGSWRGGDLRTSLPGRKSEALNSRIRDRGFALLMLRNV